LGGIQTMNTPRSRWVTAGVLLFLVILALVVRNQVKVYRSHQARAADAREKVRVRNALFDLLQPVALANCQLQRFGEKNDGGYLMCGNLLGEVRAGYSYGISGYDQWGCDISTTLGVKLHQYDCFNTDKPACPRGATVFHAECVAEGRRTTDGRVFDTIENQLARNGDGANRIVLKMDVEGAEWDAFLHASDAVLDRIDQIAVEFHGAGEANHVRALERLKQFFHVVHLHFNNFSCDPYLDPFPTWAYEVLFVNKRLGVVDPSSRPAIPHPLDAPNNPKAPDCPAKAR
jgi:hypothetical protein